VFGRRQTARYLESSLTSSGTSIETDDNSDYSADDYIHIAKECIKIGAADGDGVTWTSCTRAALGTQADVHPSGWGNPGVTANPQHWTGRKAWVSLGANSAGSWEYSDPYKTVYFDSAPRFRDGLWELSLSIGVRSFERRFYTGWTTAPVTKVSTTAANSLANVRLYMDDTTEFVASTAVDYAWLQVDDRAAAFEVISIQDSYIDIKGSVPDALFSGRITSTADRRAHMPQQWLRDVGWDFGLGSTHEGPKTTAKPCWVMGNGRNEVNPGQLALWVMLSNRGSANAWDILPDREPTAEKKGARAGAGLTTDDVDTDSWESAGCTAPHNGVFVVGAEHDESLVSFLTKDIAPILGGYVNVDSDGKLEFIRYSPVVTGNSSSLTITDDNSLGSDNFVDDESVRPSSIKIHSLYNWARRQFMEEYTAHYDDIRQLYGDAGVSIEVRSRLNVADYSSALTALAGYRSRWEHGALAHTVIVPWVGTKLGCGDRVTYTNSRVPDGEGAQGISAQTYEVVGVAPHFDKGTVTLELMKSRSAKMIAPTCIVVSQVSGSTTYNVSAKYSGASGGIDDEWAVGWYVNFVSGSTGARLLLSGVAAFEITALTSSTMEFASCPTLSAGDFVIFASHGNASSSVANSESSADQHDFLFSQNDDNQQSYTGQVWG